MAFFPGYFRLTQRSARTYRFFTDGGGGTPGPPGPQGPAGPAGQGVVDYDDRPVDQGVEYLPDNRELWRTVVTIPAGPSAGVVAYAHDLPVVFNKMIEIRGAIDDGSTFIPLPYASNTNGPFFGESIAVALDATDVYLASDGDFSAYSGFLIIDFLV